jgi:hypothetical protein
MVEINLTDMAGGFVDAWRWNRKGEIDGVVSDVKRVLKRGVCQGK